MSATRRDSGAQGHKAWAAKHHQAAFAPRRILLGPPTSPVKKPAQPPAKRLAQPPAEAKPRVEEPNERASAPMALAVPQRMEPSVEKAERIPEARTRKPKVTEAQKPLPKGRRQRPSLSEQLARIGSDASSITTQLTASFGGGSGNNAAAGDAHSDVPLFQSPSKRFVVGKLEGKLPAVVRFLANRCEYAFHHPYAPTVIDMVMYYRDMEDAVVETGRRLFRFRIARDLLHYGSDYNYRDASHVVSIEFHSEQDVRRIAKERHRIPGLRVKR